MSKSSRQKKKSKNLKWQMRKYMRWCRLYAHRVQMVEQELGEEITAC